MRRPSTLLVKLLLLALPFLAAAAWLELGLRRTPNSYSAKRRIFERQAPQVETLILGASGANQGLWPRHLGGKALNLANVGQDLRYDLALLERCAPRLPRLKRVLLPIAPISLRYRFEGSPEEWRIFCYSLYWGIPAPGLAKRMDMRSHSALALSGALPALKEARRGFRGECPEYDGDGFQAVEAPAGEDLELMINALTARKRVRYHQGIMKDSNTQANLEALDRIHRLLQDRGAELVLTALPVHPSYAEAFGPAALREQRLQIRSFMQGKAGLRFLDHLEDPAFGDGDFSDVDHLSRVGAERLSRILARELGL